MTEFEKEMKNNQTLPCMSNCGEWRVIENPEFIHSNRDYTSNNNYYQEQRRQFNTQINNKNQTNNTQNQTNNHLRRYYDIQDNHFSSDDRYLSGNQIYHPTIQFPNQSPYNDRYFHVFYDIPSTFFNYDIFIGLTKNKYDYFYHDNLC